MSARHREDRFDKALSDLTARLPGRWVAILTLLLYPGVGLLVPIALRVPYVAFVWINGVAVVWAAVLSLGWLVEQLRRRDRRHLVEWTTDLHLLTAEEFEWLVGELFRREEGWERVLETGHQDSPDGNIDLRHTENGRRKIVQCKRWSSNLVKVGEIREFAGTLLREGLSGTAGTFVTLSGFNEAATSEARQVGITLIDGVELLSRMEKVRRTEPCPLCHAPMLLDRSLSRVLNSAPITKEADDASRGDGARSVGEAMEPSHTRP